MLVVQSVKTKIGHFANLSVPIRINLSRFQGLELAMIYSLAMIYGLVDLTSPVTVLEGLTVSLMACSSSLDLQR